MTYNLSQPTGSNGVSAGAAADAKTFGAAALLTFSAGMLALIGYLLAGGFGAFLGIVAAVFGVVWWRSVNNEKVFPRDLPKSSMIGVTAAAAILGLVVFLLV